jgi:hypothetical protein
MMICLGWQGYLESFLPKIMGMLDSSILSEALELHRVFAKEEEATSAYDMGEYVDRANNLMKSFEHSQDEEE